MHQKILNDSEFGSYLASYGAGTPILMEGDDSKELFMLVEGAVAVYKGDSRIATVDDPGHLFGEISYLLGSKRTATVKAVGQVKALRIPENRITDFLDRFPEVSRDIARFLAMRLDETSHALHGLKQISEQIPEALVLTDRNGEILSFNRAAGRAFGQDWEEMAGHGLEDLFLDQEALKVAMNQVLAGNSPSQAVLSIEHPRLGPRYLAATMTVLTDSRHQFQGLLLICRDVTASHRLAMRLKKLKLWLPPLLLVLLLAGAGWLWGGFERPSGGKAVPPKELALAGIMSRQARALAPKVARLLPARDKTALLRALKESLPPKAGEQWPYQGLVVLGSSKTVVLAFNRGQGAKAAEITGQTYAHLDFRGNAENGHRLVTLYRVGPDRRSHRGVEMAFPLGPAGEPAGWLLFQMDLDYIKAKYGVDEEALLTLPTTPGTAAGVAGNR